MGSSLRVDIAFIEQNPPTASGEMHASLPPVIIATASPYATVLYAVTIASLALAQALAVAKNGPRKPYAIETCAGAAFAISIGMKNGDVFAHVPFCAAFSDSFQNVRMPPIPVPITAPTRSLNAWSRRKVRVCDRFSRRNHRELREAVHAPRFLLTDQLVGVEVFDLALRTAS